MGKRVNPKTIQIIILITFVFSFPLYAFKWGAGYNKDGLTARLWWGDNLVSEVSIGYLSSVNYSVITAGIKPINFKIYSDKYSSIMLGIYASTEVSFANQQGAGQPYNPHEYNIEFLLPEIEFIVPFIENLSVYANLGFRTVLGFAGHNKLKSIAFGFYGFDYSTLGIIYYF